LLFAGGKDSNLYAEVYLPNCKKTEHMRSVFYTIRVVVTVLSIGREITYAN
jgi:hypothetical protein